MGRRERKTVIVDNVAAQDGISAPLPGPSGADAEWTFGLHQELHCSADLIGERRFDDLFTGCQSSGCRNILSRSKLK